MILSGNNISHRSHAKMKHFDPLLEKIQGRHNSGVIENKKEQKMSLKLM
jgi:membrane protein insertase Oxa1/YidC/SpoIIIJ